MTSIDKVEHVHKIFQQCRVIFRQSMVWAEPMMYHTFVLERK